jgi:hypothetical protein
MEARFVRTYDRVSLLSQRGKAWAIVFGERPEGFDRVGPCRAVEHSLGSAYVLTPR